jgi:hypothetical protein
LIDLTDKGQLNNKPKRSVGKGRGPCVLMASAKAPEWAEIFIQVGRWWLRVLPNRTRFA